MLQYGIRVRQLKADVIAEVREGHYERKS
jgi:hypothetical protein